MFVGKSLARGTTTYLVRIDGAFGQRVVFCTGAIVLPQKRGLGRRHSPRQDDAALARNVHRKEGGEHDAQHQGRNG